MRGRNGRLRALATSTLLLSSFACQSPALLRTARMLPPGSSDWALSFNVTHVSTNLAGVPDTLEQAASSSFNYPSPLPELLYSHGMLANLELGGRLALGSGLLELNGKLRFLQVDDGRLNAALAPAIGYRALGIVNGPVLTLPALISYDVSPTWTISGGALASYAAYSVPSRLRDDEADLGGNTVYVGGGAGVEVRLGRFHVMPALELQRSVSRTGAVAQAPDIGLMFLSLTVGVGPAVSAAGASD